MNNADRVEMLEGWRDELLEKVAAIDTLLAEWQPLGGTPQLEVVPAPQADPAPKPKKPVPKTRAAQGDTKKAVVTILQQAIAAGKPALHAKEIKQRLQDDYGIEWRDASANLGSMVKRANTPIERRGDGMWGLRAPVGQERRANRWLGGEGRLCNQKGTVTGGDEGADEGDDDE